MSTSPFDGVKIFSATLARDRAQLGDRITTWLGEHPEYEISDKVVTQSSDNEFHCVAITLFWRTRPSA
ncbi:MAG TPA: hypothetical protein VGY54_12545 [Polyangiaceae bacterium]|jgi:hypothetical protein|nr:hypothetical protein [Polyangiaceae bacterium]